MKRVFLAGVALSLMAGSTMAADRGSLAGMVQQVAAAQRGGQDDGRRGPPTQTQQAQAPFGGAGGPAQRGPTPQGPAQAQAQAPAAAPGPAQRGPGPQGQAGGRGPGGQAQPQAQPPAQAQPQAQGPGGGQRGAGGVQGGQRTGGAAANARGGAQNSGPNFPVGPIGNPPVQTPRGGFPTGPLVQPSQPQRGQPQTQGRGGQPQTQGRGGQPQTQARGPGSQSGRDGQNQGPGRGQPDRRIGSAPNNANWDQNRYGRPVFNGGEYQRQRDSGRNWYSPDRFRPSYRAPRQFVIRTWSPPIGFYLRSWYSGDYLPYGWYEPPTYLDWAYFGLPFPPIGCEWVRVGRDAVLVDVWSGEVLSVEYDLFFY
ncbi:MAG: hypothetical protein JWM33_3330 [Caulobacteraceae bacterium]|nr:hypothetical protein [Caulobacteraceae bacterium]